MSLESLGEELKRRRLEKQISLTDISAETRINQKFLEAIEQGKFSILPQTYVRAFLREYSSAVGLNPDEFMKRYDSARGESHPHSAINEPRHAQPQSDAPAFPTPSKPSSQVRRTLIFGIVILGALGITLFLTNSNSNSTPPKTASEIPFDRVVKETEAAAVKLDSTPVVSIPVQPPQPDSLHLEIATIDSVWMSILIDGKKTEEYLFPPRRKRHWIAKDQFSVTMGNAGGATFQLNGKDIGALGKRGAVVRNAVITEARLKNL